MNDASASNVRPGGSPASVPEALRYTALIRTRDSSATLPKTLASLGRQSWPPSAYVIVDSGSTDETLEQLPAGATLHHFVGHSFNYAQALNQGLAHVQTPLVLLISSHTSVQNPEALEYAIRTLARDTRMGAAYFCYDDPPQLERQVIGVRNFNGFNGLWNTCSLIRTALAHQRPFRPEVFAAEDQEWAKWLIRRKGMSVARISGARLENDNPKRFSHRKLLDEYVAVALFVNRSLLHCRHLAEVAYRVVRPGRLAVRHRFFSFLLFMRLVACRWELAGRTFRASMKGPHP